MHKQRHTHVLPVWHMRQTSETGYTHSKSLLRSPRIQSVVGRGIHPCLHSPSSSTTVDVVLSGFGLGPHDDDFESLYFLISAFLEL